MFEKNNGGRPVGAKNRTTEDVRKLVLLVLSKNIDRLDAELKKLNGKAYVDAIIKIASLVLTKTANVEADVRITDFERAKQIAKVLSKSEL